MGGPLFTSLGIIILVSVALLGQIVANSRYVTNQSAFFRRFGRLEAKTHEVISPDLLNEVRERALIYEQEIEANFLEDGMVVNRHYSGKALNLCDSLLFSSLRYVALKKLGLDDKAAEAWHAIELSQKQGQWFRHPRCRHSTSRDMLLGVFAAFTQDPPGYRQHLRNLLNYTSRHSGYFSKGRIDVSFLLPGVAEIVRIFALDNGIFQYTWPLPVYYSFSTMEFSALVAPQGFQSHLIALSVWIELELQNHERYKGFARDSRSAVNKLDKLTRPFTQASLEDHRLGWVSLKLFGSDPENLFFKWLRLKTADALGPVTRGLLLNELIKMPQFPDKHLPRDCDRRADYLWQRASWEYQVSSKDCTKVFNGVDFLWLAAILLKDDG